MRLSIDQILKEKEQRRLAHEEAKFRNEHPNDFENRYAINPELKHKFEKLEEDNAREREVMFKNLAATDKQKCLLIHLGCCFNSSLTKIRASDMIEEALNKFEKKKNFRKKKWSK